MMFELWEVQGFRKRDRVRLLCVVGGRNWTDAWETVRKICPRSRGEMLELAKVKAT